MVYFIGNKEYNICKIGFSKRPYRRIKTIQDSIPFKLEIFDIIEGDFELEKMLHLKNKDFLIKGEWFQLDKIKELGLFGDLLQIQIEDLNIYSLNGYFYYSNIITYINKIRIKQCLSPITFFDYLKSNSEFIESFNKKNIIPKINDKFIHPFIAIDLLRFGGNITKIFVYENLNVFYNILRNPDEAVRLGLQEYNLNK